MTDFNHCPNNAKHIVQAGSYFDVYECKACGTLYCFKCGSRCPDCGDTGRKTVGKVWRR